MAKRQKLFHITILIVSLIFIIYKTLFPWNFSFNGYFPTLDQSYFILHWGHSTYLDIALNVLLFLPFGFGLTGYLLQRKHMGGVSVLGLVFLISFGSSSIIEVLQIFQPGRYPSLYDVFSNSAGGVLGYFFYRWFFLSYISLAIGITILAQFQTDVRNWDKTFLLLIGNELTDDRPWEGFISELHIADRVLPQEDMIHFFSGKTSFGLRGTSLLASYHFSGRGSYQDTTGHLPGLGWVGQPGHVLQTSGISLGPKHWLRSTEPPVYLTERITESSQFTLMTTVATHKTTQNGPARIISLSANPSQRNFTLGQEGDDLIFRIRTPFTGNNGTPDIIVPDIFSNTEPGKLAISYNGTVLKVYINSVHNAHTFEFSPGAVAVSFISKVKMSLLKGYKIMWYALTFIPIGIYIFFNDKITRHHIILISGGLLLPSFIMEFILMNVSGRDLILENVIIGMLCTAAPVALYLIYRKMYRY